MFVFVNGFSVRGKKKTILTCFPLYFTAESSRYLVSESKRLLILLLMLINLLLQISTNPHLSFVCASCPSPPFNLNCDSHHWLLLIRWNQISNWKTRWQPGSHCLLFSRQKRNTDYGGFKKSKHSFCKERQVRKSYMGRGGWDFSWEYLDLMVESYRVSTISMILESHTSEYFKCNVCTFEKYGECSLKL